MYGRMLRTQWYQYPTWQCLYTHTCQLFRSLIFSQDYIPLRTSPHHPSHLTGVQIHSCRCCQLPVPRPCPISTHHSRAYLAPHRREQLTLPEGFLWPIEFAQPECAVETTHDNSDRIRCFISWVISFILHNIPARQGYWKSEVQRG